jgi:deoxycytidine triphosphate deaminase
LHYHFRSPEELKRLSNSFSTGFWAQPFGSDWYGYSSEIDSTATDEHLFIIQAYSDIALKIKERHPKCKLIFLDFNNPQIMRQKIKDRFSSSEKALSDRLAHANHEKRASPKFDAIIKEDDVFKTIDKIKAYIEEQFGTLSPRRFSAGPLSDVQIIHLMRSQGSGFKLESPVNKTPETDVGGWTADLTLSSRFFIPRRKKFSRIIGRAFDLATGDADRLQNLFVEKNADPTRGLTIFAGEFVLGSTNEKLTLPDHIAGLIAGRSSYSRLGISVELSQNLLQPGHNDVVPLQIKNNLPFDIKIYPGCKIAQVALFRLSGSSSLPYGRDKRSKYLGVNLDIRSKYYDDVFYDQHRGRKPKTDWVDIAVDSAQLLLAAISFLFGIASLTASTSMQLPLYEGLTALSVVLFFAVLTSLSMSAKEYAAFERLMPPNSDGAVCYGGRRPRGSRSGN